MGWIGGHDEAQVHGSIVGRRGLEGFDEPLAQVEDETGEGLRAGIPWRQKIQNLHRGPRVPMMARRLGAEALRGPKEAVPGACVDQNDPGGGILSQDGPKVQLKLRLRRAQGKSDQDGEQGKTAH